MDLFDNVVLCNECNKKMDKVTIIKDNFKIRAWQCPACHKRILHPSDVEEYKKFSAMKQRAFHVKLRMVGNSYAVSIPHEIISFMKKTEEMHENMKKRMERMVTLAFEEMGKVSLMFDEDKENYIKKNHLKKVE